MLAGNTPASPNPSADRAIAKLKNDDEAGAADIAVAKEIQADIADEYARYGVR